MNFTVKATLGLFIRALILLPIFLSASYTGPFHYEISNISFLSLIILSVLSVLYILVITLVPAEYAIKTDIKVIEYNMSDIQVYGIKFTSFLAAILTVYLYSQAMYWQGVIVFLYAISLYMWPSYIKRIDIASKNHIFESLKNL